MENISKYYIFFIFSFILRYIEGIINILNELSKFVDISSIIEYNFDLNYHFKNNKEYKKYVEVHNWANIKLTDDIKYIIYKPLRWRPTIVNKILFYQEIKQLKRELIDKISKIIKSKNNITVFKRTKIINSFNKFKQYLVNKFNEYVMKIKNKTIRNVNINYFQIKLIKQFKYKFKNLLIINSDKNRGNVIMYDTFWNNFNLKYLNENNNNFDIFSNSITNEQIKLIINKSKKKIINIVMKYKDDIIDYKKALNKIFSGINDKIGSWAPIPKVHKKDVNGNPIKKLRPIINLKNTIISISCAIVREISRKLIFRLKTMYENYIDCDDVKDIIYTINNFNKNNILSVYDKLIICDINSMYDVISPNMVKNAFDYAIYELAPNYLNGELINLWLKSMKCIFEFCYFKYKNVLYLLKNTQIQGSKSGGDNCNLFLIIHEIKNALKFQNMTKLLFRYKDDIFMIPRNIQINTKNCKDKLINILYPQFEFEYEINKKVEICDVDIAINYDTMKLTTTTSINMNKITSYINKSSNVNQRSINGIFKVLQMRYILLDDNIDKYKYTKKRICNIFIENNEWTPFDIRLCEHISYSQRDIILNKYIEKKKIKYNEYIKSKNICLFNNKWWDKSNTINNINTYITYQKTLINENEINNIIYESYDLLDNDIKNDCNIKLYYKYQPSIQSLLR